MSSINEQSKRGSSSRIYKVWLIGVVENIFYQETFQVPSAWSASSWKRHKLSSSGLRFLISKTKLVRLPVLAFLSGYCEHQINQQTQNGIIIINLKPFKFLKTDLSHKELHSVTNVLIAKSHTFLLNKKHIQVSVSFYT